MADTAEWTWDQLKSHHEQHVSRALSDAKGDGNVRIETEGQMLMAPAGRPWVMEVPASVLQGSSGALRDEINARLCCLIEADPRRNSLTPCFKVGDRRDNLEDGRALQPGMLVFVRYSWFDESSGAWKMDDDLEPAMCERVAPVASTADVTPSAATLRMENLYVDRKFDKISYILSEPLDNSLQGVLLAYFKRLEEAKLLGEEALKSAKERKPWIRLSIMEAEDGDLAFCVQDNGTGIAHERLDSALRLKAPDTKLKINRLKNENRQLFFLDGLISEYGLGLKQAGFFLANILKVVTKLERSADEEDVYDCVMDYVALEGARGQERFHLPKQTRKAGERFTAASERVKKIELKFKWFSERLESEGKPKEEGGLGWKSETETGTAIMFSDLRDQRIGQSSTKELLRDFEQIVHDLSNIYYWYACAPEDALYSMCSHAGPSNVRSAFLTPPRPGRQLSGDSRQAEGARMASVSAKTPKEVATARKLKLTGSGSARSPVPQASRRHVSEASQRASEANMSRQPLVNVEVEFVRGDGKRTMKSLSEFGHDGEDSLFEQALDTLTREHGGSSSAPLQKVFHLAYREEVQDGKGGKTFRIKWNAAVVVCYCPFKQGNETLDQLRDRFQEGQELQGYGDGCAYWQGKLVPGTRIGKVEWLESPDIMEAVLESTSERKGSDVAPLKLKLSHATHRVVTRWFFNSRTLISDDKYLLKAFNREDLKLKDSRSAADRKQADNPIKVRHILDSTDLNNTVKGHKPGKSSALIISQSRFKTNLPNDLTIGPSSTEITMQETKPGSYPAETLVHEGDEKTLAQGIRKIYDFVLLAGKHDEIASIKVVQQQGQGSKCYTIGSVIFLGTTYQIGSVVHFVGCQKVTERELFAGKIVGLRLRADPSMERDPSLRVMERDDLEQYKLDQLKVGVRALPEVEIVEVALSWLPDEKKQDGKRVLGREHDVSWVPLKHVEQPTESIATTCTAAFCDIDGRPEEILHWSERPFAINLAVKLDEKERRPVTAALAGRQEGSDILYSGCSQVHQALRHFLERTTQRAEATTHYFHLLRTDPPVGGGLTVKNSPSVKAVHPQQASWEGGAFTFRSIPACTLVMRQQSHDSSPHPAVEATKCHLLSRMPQQKLKIIYHQNRTHDAVQLKASSTATTDEVGSSTTTVEAGSFMASCYVQIQDRSKIPIVSMPFVTESRDGLTMMRKLKLRRVQFVRKKGERDWVPILGDDNRQYKLANTWEFGKKGQGQVATDGYVTTWAASTFRVPKQFKEQNGMQMGNENVLYPFTNACLEYKVKLVAILSGDQETSTEWVPQSSWSAVVMVKPRTPSKVVLVPAPTKSTTTYFLGSELPAFQLVVTDGMEVNSSIGNLIVWEKAFLSKAELTGSSVGSGETLLKASGTAKDCSWGWGPHHQFVELLEGKQTVSVANASIRVSGLRLVPTSDAVVFPPDTPTRCEVTFSFDLGPGTRKQISLSELAVLPGPPHLLKPVEGVRMHDCDFISDADAVPGQPGTYRVKISICVYDKFNLPTHKSHESSDLSMSVKCMTKEVEVKVIGNTSASFNNAECLADFKDIRIQPNPQVPIQGLRVKLEFQVHMRSAELRNPPRACVVYANLPPLRDPNKFELLWNDEVIPYKLVGSKQLFIIEENPDAKVTGLVLRVLSALGEHLEEAQITVDCMCDVLTSGEKLPALSINSFGAGVVRSYTARQIQAAKIVHAKSTIACQCDISLRPTVAVQGMKWDVGPKNKEVLAAGKRAHLTVGRSWTDTLELRVVDRMGSSFAFDGGLPDKVMPKLAAFTLRFHSLKDTNADVVPKIKNAQVGKPSKRVVGIVGDYTVSIMSVSAPVATVEADQLRPSESMKFPVTLYTGDLDRLSLETNLELIPDRCKLPPASILLKLQDEGHNVLPMQVARGYVIKARSDSLDEVCWADLVSDLPHHFQFKELCVVRKFAQRRVPDAHPADYPLEPSLTLQVEVLQGKQNHHPKVALKLESVIGKGWQRSARVRHICAVDNLKLTAGSVLPPMSFQLKTDSGLALAGFAALSAQLSVSCCATPETNKVSTPQIAAELKDEGIILLCSSEFNTTGIYTLKIIYREERPEWEMLPPKEKTVAHSMRIEVNSNTFKKFVIRPQPNGPLYQTSDTTRTLSNELYLLKATNNVLSPSPFNADLFRVDSFGNDVRGCFDVRLFLRKQQHPEQQQERQGGASLYRDFPNCSTKLQITSTFITDFLKMAGADPLEPDQVYALSVEDVDEPGEQAAENRCRCPQTYVHTYTN